MCVQQGHSIVQIISRNEEKGKNLAQNFNAQYIPLNGTVNKNIEIVLVAITDSVFPKALDGLNFGSIPVFHTGGAVSMNVLRNTTTNYGVLYPLQSLSAEVEEIPTIPFLIEANSENSFKILNEFANTLSNNVTKVLEFKRLRLHAAAAIANNFTNYLYTCAKTYCDNEELDFNLLKPLILETANRIQNNDPEKVQTGPAKRQDVYTLGKHLQLFSEYPKLRTLYTRMTESIMHG